MDVGRSLEANFQTALYYQSDMVELMPPLGAVLDPLGYRHLRWAGRGLPADSGWQFVDEEIMKPEEYDEFIYDPSDFMVRKYWPRAYSKLAGLAGWRPARGPGLLRRPLRVRRLRYAGRAGDARGPPRGGRRGAQDRDGPGRSRAAARRGRLPSIWAAMARRRSTWWATFCAAARA